MGESKINVYGWQGVNVVKAPLQLDDNELTKAQNAQISQDGDGALDMRGGMTKLNSVAGAGAVTGFIGVPLVKPSTRTLYLGKRALAVSHGWFTSTDAFASTATGIDAGTPANPRGSDKIAAFASNEKFTGVPGCVYQGRMYYAGDDYTLYPAASHTAPTIRVFDGVTDYQLARIPYNNDIGPTTNALAVVTMAAINGAIYVATCDGGTDDSTYRGRVFLLDPSNGALTQLGVSFALGEIPYSFCGHMNRVWMGTTHLDTSNRGKIYFFRPGVDTAWTLDTTVAVNLSMVYALQSFRGLLYAGIGAKAGSNGVVQVRAVDGTWTTTETGTGTADYNGYTSLFAFQDNLYAAYQDVVSNVARIRKYTGSAWSTVYSASAYVFYASMVARNNILYGVGSQPAVTAGGLSVVVRSPDGTTWTDVSAQLTAGSRYLIPILGEIIT